MKRKAFIFLLFILSVSFLQAEMLQFKYIKGEKYKILTKVNEKVYVNGELHHTAEILTKIAFDVTDAVEKKWQISGKYQTSEKAAVNSEIYKLDEEFTSNFWIDSQGRYEIDKNYLYPLVRNIPLFPLKDINPGYKWKAKAEEIQYFRPFNIQAPISIPIEVDYEYVKNQVIDGVKCAVLKLNYNLYREFPELKGLSDWFPILIFGKVEQVFYWDIAKGRYHSYTDDFDIIYGFNDNTLYEYVGTSTGAFIESPKMDKAKIEEEIRETIEKEKIEDTSVRSDDTGVTITLQDINFLPESDMLLPKEQKKLKAIANILKKYASRDILIAGHTALAGTEEGRRLLSEKRAKAVGEYLFLLGVKNNMIFKGYGSRYPVAENDTEEGMKQNRRVEIKILEN
ncbi:MAG: OmpA family protein [Spirochaetales bacterium]|nr:OmpA family protein [Spirochaetales bacterium]